MKKYICLALSAFILNACTPAAEQVMPPLQYNGNVKTHTGRQAKLYWQTGEQHATVDQQNIAGGDIASTIIANVIDAEMRKAHPGQYTFVYGKAQQAVFMTSFKDILQNQRVFKNVTLITDKNQIKPQDVLVTLYFKSTRVSGAENNHHIMLDVVMSIHSGRSTFERTYLVESSNEGFFSTRDYKEQQTDASQQLLSKLLGGIAEWNKQVKTGATA